MVSTVTTVTAVASTASTVTAATLFSMANIMGMIAAVCLIGMLATKELVSATTGTRRNVLSKTLNIGIVPLVIIFAVVTIMKVIEVLA